MFSGKRSWTTPRDRDLDLHRIENHAGLAISVLPNGCIFAIEHQRPDGATLINQLLGSPVDGGIGRMYLRVDGEAPLPLQAPGPSANARFGFAGDRFVWEAETRGIRCRLTLSLYPQNPAWLWQLEAMNIGAAARSLDAILIQDIGLGDRGFLMNNEAYASQYIDHHVARHPVYGQVVMSRQNLAQGGLNPWVAHGCLDGASGFATDGMQMRLALHLEQACRTRGCSTSSLVPRSNPRQPRWRRARARPGASSAFMCPIIRKHRAMAISRGSMP
jgi:1,2-beta-oligoglucan phosphorylase